MDHEPDYGSVCVVTLVVVLVLQASLCMDFLGKGDSAALTWEDMMLIILLTLCTHRHAFGVQREDQVKN